MLTRPRILALAAASALAFGCNKSADNGTGQTTPPASIGGPTQQERAIHQAKVVVSDFLEAMRRGDEAKARSLLTKVARQKADEQKGFLAQGGDEGGKIEVDDPSFPSPDDHEVAHVPTRWIDQDAMGKSRTERATWVCRLEPEGWRVAGFAAEVFEGEDPVFMNFEDPEDMARHRQMMEEEIQRRSKAETTTRSSGEAPAQAENKPKDAFQR